MTTPQMEVVSWTPYAFWTFKTTVTECPICKSHFEEPCLTCVNDHVKGDLICDVTKGKCGHCFHKHCIDKWLLKSTICPICNLPYNTEVKDMGNTADWMKLAKKT